MAKDIYSIMESKKFRIEITKAVENTEKGYETFVFECGSQDEKTKSVNNNLYRAEVRITECQGAYKDNCNISIYGVSLDKLSNLTFITWDSINGVDKRNTVKVIVDGITVYAGDIYRVYADFGEAPDVCLRITGVIGKYISARSTVDKSILAEENRTIGSVFQTLCNEVGIPLEIGEETSKKVCPDIILDGNLYNQILKLAKKLGLNFHLTSSSLRVWDEEKEDFPPNRIEIIDYTNGLIGYPTFIDLGASFRGLFNPSLKPGNIIKLFSIVPGITHFYWIAAKTSIISSMPNGKWESFYECYFVKDEVSLKYVGE